MHTERCIALETDHTSHANTAPQLQRAVPITNEHIEFAIVVHVDQHRCTATRHFDVLKVIADERKLWLRVRARIAIQVDRARGLANHKFGQPITVQITKRWRTVRAARDRHQRSVPHDPRGQRACAHVAVPLQPIAPRADHNVQQRVAVEIDHGRRIIEVAAYRQHTALAKRWVRCRTNVGEPRDRASRSVLW